MNIVWPTPPEHNSFAAYVAASHGITLHSKGFDEAYDAVIGRRDISKKPLPVSLAQFVAENHSSLEILRQEGFTHPFQVPPSTGLMEDTEYLSDFRSMARLLVIEGDVRAKQGNLRGAIDSNLDAVRLGEDISRNGTLVHYNTSIACQRIGQRGLWRQLKQYSADDARYAVRRLEELSLRQQTLSESLEGEKRYGQTTLRTFFTTFFTSPDTSAETNSEGKAKTRPDAFTYWLNHKRSPFYAVWSKQSIWDNYTSYFDSQIRRSRERYDPRATETPIPSDMFSQLLVPVIQSSNFKAASFTAERGLLTTALAVQAYQREHNGKPPTSLAELTPGYLTATPADPFAALPNTPLRYRREGTENQFVLYSVGPNGKDDGGKRIDNRRFLKDLAPGEKRADFVLAGSDGDIIAGLNF